MFRSQLEQARQNSIQREDAQWRSTVKVRTPHPKQQLFLRSKAKRKVIRAGRRGGKTTGIGILAAEKFVEGWRILYATPTQDQVAKFWAEVKLALAAPLEAGILYKNETSHIIEVPGTENRIRAKTAWNADTLRGDYADLLILDEYQLMAEEAWDEVGAPMLLDHNGDAVFIYTPISMQSRARTKAKDPRHAAKMFKKAAADKTGRWEAFHFTSHDNPHISEEGLEDITGDMTVLSYKQEILAEDTDEAPGALFKQRDIDKGRLTQAPQLVRVGVAVDPPGGVTECGIVVGGIDAKGEGYILDDFSLKGSPETWANEVLAAYSLHEADLIIVEINFGGDMVKTTLRATEGGKDANIKTVHASRGKAVRAEPVSAKYEQGLVHHVGHFGLLEGELTSWVPGTGMPSPNRLDACVWLLTELMIKNRKREAESYQGTG